MPSRYPDFGGRLFGQRTPFRVEALQQNRLGVLDGPAGVAAVGNAGEDRRRISGPKKFSFYLRLLRIERGSRSGTAWRGAARVLSLIPVKFES
jgi:hypothetical protein